MEKFSTNVSVRKSSVYPAHFSFRAFPFSPMTSAGHKFAGSSAYFTTLKQLTDELNNNYTDTMASVKGWDTLGSKWKNSRENE